MIFCASSFYRLTQTNHLFEPNRNRALFFDENNQLKLLTLHKTLKLIALFHKQYFNKLPFLPIIRRQFHTIMLQQNFALRLLLFGSGIQLK